MAGRDDFLFSVILYQVILLKTLMAENDYDFDKY